MAVLEYQEGEHPGGFIGFRVARTIGDDNDYRQMYFGLREYSYDTAKQLAHEIDKEWLEQARTVVQGKRLEGLINPTENGIATGLRAYIAAEGKKQKSGKEWYYTPVFIARIGKHKERLYRIPKLSYEEAFRQAVMTVAEYYGYTNSEIASLMAKMPPKSFFTDELHHRLRLRGHHIPVDHIADKLEVQENQ
ncbi:hypothetical protein [Neptuniibacter sp. QD37_11]|uniref:hypothetical protein n=1 Tax=Neptuniibacter sp. QD37_11 TaxID=3398209 RepID=UPI0039F5E0C0